MAPGLLHVTMDPKESMSSSDFHDWYNNEHGPTRLRLPFIDSGTRYERHVPITPTAVTTSSPPWIALYDVSDIAMLESQNYLRLRAPPVKSQREINVMKQITVDRRLYESKTSHENANCAEDSAMEPNTNLIEVQIDLHEGEDIEAKADCLLAMIMDWMKVVPNWERVRSYRSKSQFVVLCSVPRETLDNPDVHAAMKLTLASTEFGSAAGAQSIRMWKLYYAFGPAPRHLSQDGELWIHYGTRTIPQSKGLTGVAAVESYVTLDDGCTLPFRLEGSTEPCSPVIVLVNSVMVHWDIWDEFLAAFFAIGKNQQYRVLRFLPRGRFPPLRDSDTARGPVTIDRLASDITGLLYALKINTVECVMGVSLGGATALRAALLYPSLFKSFIACDTNASAPPGNAIAWNQRIALSEKEGAVVATSQGMEAVVGEDLADITVRRWAIPESFEIGDLSRRLHRIKQGVKESSLEGFKEQVQALYDYDFWSDMKSAKSRGAFVVGAGDGALPQGMKKMAEGYSTGTKLHVIDGAGHLPMVEKPVETAQILSDFINA